VIMDVVRGLLVASGAVLFIVGWLTGNPLLLFLSVPTELVAGGILVLTYGGLPPRS